MTQQNTEQTVPPQAVILDTVMQFFRSRVTQVFADLQIADAIAAGRARKKIGSAAAARSATIAR